jgi:ribose 5-phosphate isomerase A
VAHTLSNARKSDDGRDAAKRQAAEAAAELVRDGDVVGLGTGSTAIHMVRRLGARVRGGLRIRGIPTSLATEAAAREHGIPLVGLGEVTEIHITIDGADEIDPTLNLIKGLGGALLREKVVASMSKRLVIVADESKLVDRLGAKAPLPLEVVPFAAPTVARALARHAWTTTARLDAQGRTFHTDNGNIILDARGGDLRDPWRVERELRSIPGLVETGLFIGMASEAFVAAFDGSVRTLRR